MAELMKTGKPWALAHQRQRRQAFFAAARKAAINFFDAEGYCLIGDGHAEGAACTKATNPHFHLREIVHSAAAFFAGNAQDAELANRILAHANFSSCDFTAMSLIKIFIRQGRLVTPANRRKLLPYIEKEIARVQKPHNAFVGYNDNYPAMDIFIMVVGGELTGNKKAVQAGLDNLYSMRDLLARQGFFSEYNSPTYGGVTLHGLGETACCARHPEARRLAQEGAERMWLDFALHWHPEISWHAGPHSRSYHSNSIGWNGLTAAVMWVVFGDVIVPNPFNTIFGQNTEGIGAALANFLQFYQAGWSEYAGTLHRIQDYIGELVLSKSYPFRVKGTTECGTFHAGKYHCRSNGAFSHVPGYCADFGASSAELTTYMEADFALGTASRMFLDGGQSEFFYEIHKRKPQVKKWDDIRTVFTRYVLNESQPGAPTAMSLLSQKGVGFTVQDDRRALVLCNPNGADHENIRSLKLALILQEITAPLDEIWIGGRKLKNGDGEAKNSDWVILRDGNILLAFLPLAQSDLGRKVTIRSRRENGYRVISFFNYEGRTRNFAQPDLKRIQNGFVFEVSTLREHKSIPAFLKTLRRAELSDTTLMEARQVRYLRAGREMLLWMDPLQQTVKAASLNGRATTCPPLEADGLDLRKVPWLGKGLFHKNLAWWTRIANRPAIPGLEGVIGRLVSPARMAK